MQIKDYFSKKPEITAAYLFGSFARGDANDYSDIDLGLIFKKKESKAFVLPEVQMAGELSKITGKEVEIQDLALSPVDFSHRVISEGQLIYCSDEKIRVEFEEKLYGTFLI